MSSAAEWNLLVEARWWTMEAIKHPELITTGLAMIFFGMAFTAKQVKAIRERDNNQSQMRHYSEEKGWHTSPKRPGDTLEVHHIQPQAWLIAQGIDPDVPENAITLWRREHTGRGARPGEFVVHPDMQGAFDKYRNGDKDAFKNAAKTHQEKAKKGEVFWNDEHDVEMQQTALDRTKEASSRGWHWPKHTKRKK